MRKMPKIMQSFRVEDIVETVGRRQSWSIYITRVEEKTSHYWSASDRGIRDDVEVCQGPLTFVGPTSSPKNKMLSWSIAEKQIHENLKHGYVIIPPSFLKRHIYRALLTPTEIHPELKTMGEPWEDVVWFRIARRMELRRAEPLPPVLHKMEGGSDFAQKYGILMLAYREMEY